MESKDFQDKNKTNAVSKISPKLAGHHILVHLWQLTFWDTDTTTYTASESGTTTNCFPEDKEMSYNVYKFGLPSIYQIQRRLYTPIVFLIRFWNKFTTLVRKSRKI